ncbi:MAG: hypothetical protein ACYDCG_13375 [Candidatus Acidiferrales bacterium]
MRLSKSFMVEPEINDYVDAIKGARSASERVNEMQILYDQHLQKCIKINDFNCLWNEHL